MRHRNLVLALAVVVGILAMGGLSFGAYHHQGEIDSVHFLNVYSDKAGTKLDTCLLSTCFSGSY